MECAADAAPISWKGAILAIKNPLMSEEHRSGAIRQMCDVEQTSMLSVNSLRILPPLLVRVK